MPQKLLNVTLQMHDFTKHIMCASELGAIQFILIEVLLIDHGNADQVDFKCGYYHV